MSKKTISWLMVLALLLPVALTACGPETVEEPAVEEPIVVEETEEVIAVEEPVVIEEPVVDSMFADVDPSGQTVTFWHVWGTGSTGEGLTAIVEEFNATNEWGITVEAVDQGRYNDLEDAMNAAIQSGDVPDIAVGYTNALDIWNSVGTLVDINDYVVDPLYGLTEEEIADFYPGAWASGLNADGVRVGFPHGQSANVMFYNYTWAGELGFSNAPATWAEFKEQACAAAAANLADENPDNDGTGGLVMYAGASNVAPWVFASGDDMINEAGDGYDFSSAAVTATAEFWWDLWNESCGFATESYPNPEFASRQALFTMSSTAGYTYQADAFEAEGAIQDEWGFIPFPGKDGGVAVNAYGQNSAIVNTTAEKDLAAWLFIKWFTSPEVNAKWIEASAYHPIRISAVDLLAGYIAENPLWATGIDLLPLGQAEPAWGSWSSVRRSVGDTFAAVLQGAREDIPGLLAELDATAAEAIEELQ